MNHLNLPIRQIAYAVADPVAAATRHHEMYGSGPFFFARHVPVENFVHRGERHEFDHSTLFGQWGDVMVEFCVQHNDAPSYVHDMFPAGSGLEGLHHVALLVPDVDRAVANLASRGCDVCSRFMVGSGESAFEVTFVDTRSATGHMTEIYADKAPLSDLYAMCKAAAGDFANRPLVEYLGL